MPRLQSPIVSFPIELVLLLSLLFLTTFSWSLNASNPNDSTDMNTAASIKTQKTIALITGANRGIGKEVCRQLASDPYNYICLLGSRSIEKGIEAAKEIGGESNNDNSNIHPIEIDVTNEASITAAKEYIERHYGHLDVLINNAGINYDSWQSPASANIQTVRETIETNLLGAWQCTVTMLPLLKVKQQDTSNRISGSLRPAPSRIVNVSSGAGSILDTSSSGTPAYSVSKAALNMLTIKLSAELKSQNFKVNVVCPGWIATDMGGAGGQPVQVGGKSVVWAATLDESGPTGGFFRHGKPIHW